MGIQSHTDSYGHSIKTQSGQLRYREFDAKTGATTRDSTYVITARQISHERYGASENPFVMVKGKVPFRAPSSYERTVLEMQWFPGRWSRTYLGKRYLWEGVDNLLAGSLRQLPMFTGDRSEMAVADAAHRDIAANAALRDLGGQKVNYMQTLAEAKRTHSGLADKSIQLLRAIRLIRRGNFRAAARILGLTDSRGYADNWLFYQYGLLPLLSDLHGTYELLKDQLTTPPLIISGFGKSQWEITDAERTHLSLSNRRGKYVAEAQCKLYGTVKDSYLRTATQFGLANPLSIAWELVPWSFIVDWYLPIGNALEALTAPLGLDFLGGYTSQRVVAELTGDFNGWNGSGTPFRVQVNRHAYKRVKLGSWPQPLPRVKSPFTTTRAYTALALLRTLQK